MLVNVTLPNVTAMSSVLIDHRLKPELNLLKPKLPRRPVPEGNSKRRQLVSIETIVSNDHDCQYDAVKVSTLGLARYQATTFRNPDSKSLVFDIYQSLVFPHQFCPADKEKSGRLHASAQPCAVLILRNLSHSTNDLRIFSQGEPSGRRRLFISAGNLPNFSKCARSGKNCLPARNQRQEPLVSFWNINAAQVKRAFRRQIA